jgi:hypothetical protein
MREWVSSTLAACGMLMSASLFAGLPAQAMPLASPSGLRTAIHEAAAQQVRYICRRGHRCYYVTRPHLYYARPYAYARPVDGWSSDSAHPPYNPYYWGSGAMGGGR